MWSHAFRGSKAIGARILFAGALALLVAAPRAAWTADADRDGIDDATDNCPNDANPGQFDTDNDRIGNQCDVCLADPQPSPDADGDGVGDACDDCPNTKAEIPDRLGNFDFAIDAHGCAVSQRCPCAGPPRKPPRSWKGRRFYLGCVTKRTRKMRRAGELTFSERRRLLTNAKASGCGRLRGQPGDRDGDGIRDDGDESGIIGDNLCPHKQTVGCDDNCRRDWNPKQRDLDGNRRGNACDPDDDDDGIPDREDNCPGKSNPQQGDDDDDGVGDDCDDCPDSDANADVNRKGCS